MTTRRVRPTSNADSENGPLTIPGEAEEAKESPPSDSVVASTGDLLTTMCRSSLTSLADSVLSEAEEADEGRPSGSVAASSGELLTMCRGSLGSLADSENGPLTVLGQAEEAEESRPSVSAAAAAAAAGDLLTTKCRWFTSQDFKKIV